MTARPPEDESEIIPGAIAERIVRETKLHLNLAQDTIVITEDKVRLCLIEHVGRMEAKKDWIAPAGILASIVLTLVTTDFRDWHLKAEEWKAIFYVATILVAFWLLRSLGRAFWRSSINDVVSEMKRVGKAQAGGPQPGPAQGATETGRSRPITWWIGGRRVP